MLKARIVGGQKQYVLNGPDKYTYRLLGEKEEVQIQICIQNEGDFKRVWGFDPDLGDMIEIDLQKAKVRKTRTKKKEE